MVQPLWKTVWWLLRKLELPYDPSILLLGIYPKNQKQRLQHVSVIVHWNIIHKAKIEEKVKGASVDK